MARSVPGRMCCREMLREKLHELQGSKGFSLLPPAMLVFRQELPARLSRCGNRIRVIAVVLFAEERRNRAGLARGKGFAWPPGQHDSEDRPGVGRAFHCNFAAVILHDFLDNG